MERTIRRIDPTDRKDGFIANDRICFNFPLGKFDLSTLKLYFKAVVNGSAVNYQALPRDVETMIEQMTVYVGNTPVNNIMYYNQIFRTLIDFNGSIETRSERALLSNSAYITNGLNNVVFNVNNYQYCINQWLGFLGSDKVIDVEKLGGLRVELLLAPNQVLLGSVTTSTYTLNDVHLSIDDVKGVDVPVEFSYDDFNTFLQYNNSFNQQTTIDLPMNTDYVLATFLPSNYRSRAIALTTDKIGTSWYFSRGTGNGNSFPTLAWNFRINNKRLSNYWLNAEVAPEYMRNIFPKTGVSYNPFFTKTGTMGNVTPTEWNQNYWTTGYIIGKHQSPSNFMFESQAVGNTTSTFTLLMVKSTKYISLIS